MQNNFLDTILINIQNCDKSYYSNALILNAIFSYKNIGLVNNKIVITDIACSSFPTSDYLEFFKFLKSAGFTDFIFAEQSTATMMLLNQMLSLGNTKVVGAVSISLYNYILPALIISFKQVLTFCQLYVIIVL